MHEELRREERLQSKGGILYVAPSLGSTTKIRAGLVANLSDSGACIYTQDCLSDNDVIKVYFRDISQSSMEAKVKWCTRDNNDLFKVGLLLDN